MEIKLVVIESTFVREIYRLLRLFMVKRLQKLPLFFDGVATGVS